VIVAARIFVVGGLTSFRALFYWLTPWIYVPTMLIAPIFQILLFAYIGRSAGLESDEFYLIGNALQYAAIPCLFAMAQMVGGERYQNTLSAILVSPAPRIPLFFGRSLPVVINGAFVAAFSLLVGALILGVHLPASSLAPLLLIVLIAAFSCTGLGLVNAAASLRIRENAVLSNVIFGFLLIFTGANVPLDSLPDWMGTMAQGLPFTHAIKAAREVAAGASLGDVRGLLGAELLVGAIYGVAGYALLRWFEVLGRRYATLERS
jgi:ABC-2 type transport system permease protein